MAIKDSAYNSKPAKLPGLPEVPRSLDAPTYRLLEAIKEHLEVRNGGRGNVFERVVTERRLTEFIESPEFRQVVVGAQGSSAAPFVPIRPATAFDITAEVRRALDRLKASAPPSQTENLIGALRQELMGLLSGATSERSVALAMTNEARLRANAVATEAAVRAQALAQEQSDRAQAVADEATARVAGIAQSTLGWSEGLVTEARVRASQIDLNANSILRAALASDNARTDAAASLAVAKSTLETTIEDGISAEIVSRETLAVQLRGAYTGADLNAISSGLFHQERTARVTAVESLTQQITLLSAGAGEQFDWNRIWYFDTGTESWSGNGTPTAAAGYLRPANQASGAYVESPIGVGSDGTQYGEVRLRVRKTGAPVFAGFLWWRGVGDSTWSSARRVALTEPSFDGNGIGLITASPGWTLIVDRLRIDLSSAQTGTDFFELDWVALGRPSPGASSAQLFNEQVVRANADGALASDISTLTAKTDANLAALNVEQIARASADSALASQSLALVASVGQSASALKSEQEVRSRADEAQASQVFGLSAVLGENLSGISVEQRARTTSDEANATLTQALVASLGNTQAGVVAEQQARATADAANASNAITLSAALGESVAALRVEQQTRATADAATASSLSTLVVGTASGLQASIETLQGVTADLSTASAQSSTTLVSLTRKTDASLDDLAEAALRNALGADRALGFFSETLALATTQLKTDIEEGVSAEAELRALLVAQVGNNLGVFESYVLTQADANSATTTSLGLLSAQTQDNQAAILLEQSVRTDENSATTSLIEGVTASVGDVASAVLSEQQARATEQAATTSTLQVLTAITAGNTAAVVTEQQARTTQSQSVALAVSALTAATGNSVASIVSEQFARTTSIEAVALLAQTLSVQVSGSTAAVSTESTARASLGSALAGLVQSVGVRLDSGDFASVKAVTQASANAVDGLSAQYTLKVNTNGKIAGFDISSTSPVVGPSTSAFVIVADKFVIASSGEADGHIPFGIDTVTGNIFLSGAVRINAGGNTLATLAANAAEMAMTFIGSFASAPSTAGRKKNNVYLNTTSGNSFILSADSGSWLAYLDRGLAGSRGSITLYQTGAFTPAAATAAILAVTNTANVMGDTVTFTSGSVATTRYWDLTAWVSPGVVIDGNLLVSGTVSAGSLKAQSGNFLGPVRADQQLGEASGVTLGVHQAQPTILGNDFRLGSGLTNRWRVGVLGHAVLSTPALGGNNNAGAVAVAGVSGGNETARGSFGGYFEAAGGNDGAGVFGKHLGFSTINLSAAPIGVRGDAVPYLVNGTSAVRRAFGVYGSVAGWCTPGDGAGIFAQGRRDFVGGEFKETPGLRVEGQLYWYGVGGSGATLINAPTTLVTDVLRGNGTWGPPPATGSSVAWDAITGKPTTFTPSAHDQDWGTITGKPTTFTPSAHNQAWTTITGVPTTFPPAVHTHLLQDIIAGGLARTFSFSQDNGVTWNAILLRKD